MAPDWGFLTAASSGAPAAAAFDDWSSLDQHLADCRSGHMPQLTAVTCFWADAAEDDDAASPWADSWSDDLSEDVVAAVNRGAQLELEPREHARRLSAVAGCSEGDHSD